MRIVFDARCIRSGMTGVGYYASYLAGALPEARPDDFFIFLALREQNPDLYPRSAIYQPNVEWLAVPADYEDHPGGDWWQHMRLPRMLDVLEADVFHGPSFLLPFGPRHPRAAQVATIHDLSVFSEPDAYPPRFRAYLQWVIRRVVRRADAILCPCEFVRRDILNRIPGAAPEKLDVVPHAPADAFHREPDEPLQATRERLGLPPRFLLMVGTFERRKNPAFFPAFYQALERILGCAPPPLVWAGRKGHDHESLLEQLEPLRRRGLFVPRHDLHVGDLPAVYRMADLLVYPSRNEGFGMPVCEAMASGLPVIAADATSLPETVGAGGVCLPLDATERWAAEAAALLRDPDARGRAARRAKAMYESATWREVALRTAKVYEKAYEKRYGSPPSSSSR